MMHRFIVLYRAPQSVAHRFATATAAEAATGMQLWVDWALQIGTALIDPGKPLGNAKDVTAGGVTSSASDVIGMSILQAESMDDALAMVDKHHHLHWAEDCRITVLEEMPIPEMEANPPGPTTAPDPVPITVPILRTFPGPEARRSP